MWNKSNISAIAGVFAYIVTILILFVPYRGEQAVMIMDWRSPVAIITISLFIVSVILYAISIFKKELDFHQKKTILDQRQNELPHFREVIGNIVKRLNELAIEASMLPLEDYYNKYLKLNNTFNSIYKNLPHKNPELRRNVAIGTSLIAKGFSAKNTYLYELEGKDCILNDLMYEYTKGLARFGNKQLTKDVKTLFKFIRLYNSTKSMADLAKINNFTFTDPKHINTIYEQPKRLEPFIESAYKRVNIDIDNLLIGTDL